MSINQNNTSAPTQILAIGEQAVKMIREDCGDKIKDTSLVLVSPTETSAAVVVTLNDGEVRLYSFDRIIGGEIVGMSVLTPDTSKLNPGSIALYNVISPEQVLLTSVPLDNHDEAAVGITEDGELYWSVASQWNNKGVLYEVKIDGTKQVIATSVVANGTGSPIVYDAAGRLYWTYIHKAEYSVVNNVLTWNNLESGQYLMIRTDRTFKGNLIKDQVQSWLDANMDRTGLKTTEIFINIFGTIAVVNAVLAEGQLKVFIFNISENKITKITCLETEKDEIESWLSSTFLFNAARNEIIIQSALHLYILCKVNDEWVVKDKPMSIPQSDENEIRTEVMNWLGERYDMDAISYSKIVTDVMLKLAVIGVIAAEKAPLLHVFEFDAGQISTVSTVIPNPEDANKWDGSDIQVAGDGSSIRLIPNSFSGSGDIMLDKNSGVWAVVDQAPSISGTICDYLRKMYAVADHDRLRIVINAEKTVAVSSISLWPGRQLLHVYDLEGDALKNITTFEACPNEGNHWTYGSISFDEHDGSVVIQCAFSNYRIQHVEGEWRMVDRMGVTPRQRYTRPEPQPFERPSTHDYGYGPRNPDGQPWSPQGQRFEVPHPMFGPGYHPVQIPKTERHQMIVPTTLNESELLTFADSVGWRLVFQEGQMFIFSLPSGPLVLNQNTLCFKLIEPLPVSVTGMSV